MNAIIGGHISLDAVMTSNSRDIVKIIYDKYRLETVKRSSFHFPEKKQYDKINAYCEAHRIPIEYLDDKAFAALTGSESYGGIAAEVGDRRYTDCNEIIAKKPNGFFAVLDGIEDPFNFGYVLRSFYAAGADAVFLPERNFMNATATVIRSSAGASELLMTGTYGDPEELISTLHSKGVYIVTTAKTGEAVDLYSADMKRPLCVVIGGERRGISSKVLALSDKLVKISYPRDTAISLPASSAAAIIAFEAARQINRRNTPSARRPQ